MSMPDLLDALLVDYTPPPLPAGLAGRVADCALTLPQAAALPRAAARSSWHDRRGRWLRRPLVMGGVALGLAFSGAVAATLAGIEVVLPDKVQTVLAEVPFFGRMAKAEPPPEAPPPPRARERRQATIDVEPAAPVVEVGPDPLLRMQRAGAVRRWLRAYQMVAERRAAGLPTPRADRIERMIEERLVRRGVLPEDPAERALVRDAARQVWRERAAARRARFQGQDAVPPAAGEETDGAPGDAASPDRAQMPPDWFERRRIMRALRLERMQRWRERRRAMPPPWQQAEPAAPNEPVERVEDPQPQASTNDSLAAGIPESTIDLAGGG